MPYRQHRTDRALTGCLMGLISIVIVVILVAVIVLAAANS